MREEMKESLLTQAEKIQAAGLGSTQGPTPADIERHRAIVADLYGQPQGSRNKYWSELSIEEKIERCREQVKILREEFQYIHRLGDQMRKWHAEFVQHRHQLDDGGRVVLPVQERANETIGYFTTDKLAESDPSKVYF